MFAAAAGLRELANGWRRRGLTDAGWPAVEAIAAVIAAILVTAMTVRPWVMAESHSDERRAAAAATTGTAAQDSTSREILIAGYAGGPLYYRSDVRLQQPGGTDVLLKRLGWDGDMFYFPIDGGIRSVEWHGASGLMIDFLHNKAIARLGRGAHGRKLAHPIVETVEATGTIAGKPAPPRVPLTDVFERFEFTHGHNVLLFTPLLRFASLYPGVRPYVGVGAGVAVPHVEVWAPNSDKLLRTNEYQLGGPAAQFVAGLELRVGRGSYFVEYKFTYAWIRAALTGDHSWLNFNMPGDLWRQFRRWWRGEEPRFGHISTRLGAHQLMVGGGYWLRRAAKAP